MNGIRVRVTRIAGRKGGKVFYTYKITLPKRVVDALGYASERELTLEVVVYNGKKAILLHN